MTTTKYAQIPMIKGGVAFSDPVYDETVWCQYRKEFTETDWLMKMDSRVEDGIVYFQMMLGRTTFSGSIKTEKDDLGLRFSFPQRYEYDAREIGIDTAKVFCGSLDNFRMFGEEAALYTAADGLFGDLAIFTCKGENTPSGFILLGSVDEDITNEKDIFQHFVSSFDGKEIEKELYERRSDPTTLANKLCITAEERTAKAAEQTNDNSEKKKSQTRGDGPELG